jgi:rod shape-determining protein MreB and related proteins
MQPLSPELFIRYMREVYNLLIGEKTAELVIMTLASNPPKPEDAVESVALRGRHLITGLPTGVEILRLELRQVVLRDPNSNWVIPGKG